MAEKNKVLIKIYFMNNRQELIKLYIFKIKYDIL